MATALVIGATGVAGSYLCRHLLNSGSWKIYGVSRRHAEEFRGQEGYSHVTANLLDPDDSAAALSRIEDVTHIFSCGYVDRPTSAALIEANTALLRNALLPIERSSPGLRKLVLLQGTKYYGCHLGPFKTPAKESDPRIANQDFFYYDQEDFVRREQVGKAWEWTAMRPHSICGFATGNPMNIITVIGVFAAICKEMGLPLAYPGSKLSFQTLFQLTDSRLLASAMEWAALSGDAAGEAFNVINGDYFRWSNVWPRIAELFEIEAAGPADFKLAEIMPARAEEWNGMVKKHKLAPHSFADIASWPYGDYVFGIDYDVMSDVTKIRRKGFALNVDSEEMLIEMLGDLRHRRILP